MFWRKEKSLTHVRNPSMIHLLSTCLLSHSTDWSILALTKGGKNYFLDQTLQAQTGYESTQKGFGVRTVATRRHAGNKTKVTDKFNIWYIMVHETYHRTEKTILNEEFKRAEMEKTVVYFQTLSEYRLPRPYQTERNYQLGSIYCVKFKHSLSMFLLSDLLGDLMDVHWQENY
jgi:hypothetical protein